MFVMTHSIKIGTFKAFKCSSCEWNHEVDKYASWAKIVVPAMTLLRTTSDPYGTKVPTAQEITEGMPVQIFAGYNGSNELRFKGFVSKLNLEIPLEIECEGYSYLLRKVSITKTYVNSTVKDILQDITAGTSIKLSSRIPNIPIPKAKFNRALGTQVLEWLQKKCLLTVYFSFDTLYCGLRNVQAPSNAIFDIGWNTVDENSLVFNGYKEFSTVRMQVSYRKKNGDLVIQETDGNGTVRRERMTVDLGDNWRKLVAQDQQLIHTNRGYSGAVTGFLVPYVEPGMSATISDARYPERKGTYFIDKVHGHYGPSGGRQVINLGFTL